METTNVGTFEISKIFENSAEISAGNLPPSQIEKKIFPKFRQKFLHPPEISGRKFFGHLGTLKGSSSDFTRLKK